METCKEPITGEHRVSWFEPQGPQKTLTWKHFGQGGGVMNLYFSRKT